MEQKRNLKSFKVIGQYKNGNYMVYMMNDGTKIRYTDDDYFQPEFPESIDCLITTSCSLGCQQCYENCVPNGKYWDIQKNQWINSLHPYTELSINGNDFTDIPSLNSVLLDLSNKPIIVNATFHMDQYCKNYTEIRTYQNQKLLYGIGVSINKVYQDREYKLLKICDNVVIHVVAGIFNKEIYESLKSVENAKILILGYKNIGRGVLYQYLYSKEVESNIKWLSDNIKDIMQSFEVCSFDNLALEQLNMQEKMTEQEWKHHYMGDDGQFTMYIDAVNNTFAKDSTQPEENRYSYNTLNNTYFDIKDMFNKIRIDTNPEVDKLDLD